MRGLLCAVAGGAWAVVPPTDGLGGFVQWVVLFAALLFLVDLDLFLFAVGTVTLRLLSREGSERRDKAKSDRTGKDWKKSLHRKAPYSFLPF